jgi:hypothetical protein
MHNIPPTHSSSATGGNRGNTRSNTSHPLKNFNLESHDASNSTEKKLPSPSDLVKEGKKRTKSEKTAQKLLEEMRKMQKNAKANKQRKINRSKEKRLGEEDNSNPHNTSLNDDEKLQLLSFQLEDKIQGLINSFTAQGQEVEKINISQLIELTQVISDNMIHLEASDRTEWNVQIQYPPIFSGATLTLIEHRQAPKEYNLVFANLTAQAQALLEMKKDSLHKELATREIAINQIITHREEGSLSDYLRRDGQQQNQGQQEEQQNPQQDLENHNAFETAKMI